MFDSLSISPSSTPKDNNPTTVAPKSTITSNITEEDDDDGFGDFIDAESPEENVNIDNSTLLSTLTPAAAATSISAPSQQSSYVPQPKYEIQAQINQLSSHDPKIPIKFGQHIEKTPSVPNQKGGIPSSNVPTPQWDSIISARPGNSHGGEGKPKVAPIIESVTKPLQTNSTGTDRNILKSSNIHGKPSNNTTSHTLVKSNVASKPTYPLSSSTASIPTKQATSQPSLLDLDSFDPPTSSPTPPPNGLQILNPLQPLNTSTQSLPLETTSSTRQYIKDNNNNNNDDDEWDSFQESNSPLTSPIKSQTTPVKKQLVASSSSPLSPKNSKPKHSILSKSTPNDSASNELSPVPNSNNQPALPPSSVLAIPNSIALLTLFHTQIIRIIDPLFKSIIPLPYNLKKRVLNNAKTKEFLRGYFETVRIAARVMMGRYRRLFTSSTSKKNLQQQQEEQLELCLKADREARELERIWKEEIAPRLRAANISISSSSALTSSSRSKGLVESSFPDLQASTVVSKSAHGTSGAGDFNSFNATGVDTLGTPSVERHCMLCGLLKSERVKYLSKTFHGKNDYEWLEGNSQQSFANIKKGKTIDIPKDQDSALFVGHASCLKFWKHLPSYQVSL